MTEIDPNRPKVTPPAVVNNINNNYSPEGEVVFGQAYIPPYEPCPACPNCPSLPRCPKGKQGC